MVNEENFNHFTVLLSGWSRPTRVESAAEEEEEEHQQELQQQQQAEDERNDRTHAPRRC